MGQAQPEEEPVHDSANPRGPRQATAFGLDLYCEARLSFLAGSSARATGHDLAISVLNDDAELKWPAAAELACEERQPDGRLVYRIESDPRAGYLISGPDYGAYGLSADGRELR